MTLIDKIIVEREYKNAVRQMRDNQRQREFYSEFYSEREPCGKGSALLMRTTR